MWNALLRKSGGAVNGNAPTTRRRYERRESDLCMARVKGQCFPVKDWSFGGVQLDADGRSFQLGHMFDVVLSVKAQDRIWDINHTATVVRKGDEAVALQFDPLPGHVRIQMENIQRMLHTPRYAGY